MIVITCPYCGEARHEEELTYGGEAEILRPTPPAMAADEGWTDYLHFRANPKGLLAEQWCCSAGCGQWFKVARDTVSHRIVDVVRFDRRLTAGGTK
jgi:sarcosine oxidase subunit delta